MRTYLFVILCTNKLFNSIQFNGWIDIVLTSINSQIYISEITRGELITDHYIIKFNINIKKNVPIVKLIKYRSINKINIKDFIDNILSSLEGNILSSLVLNDCLTSTLDKFAPIKRLNITYHAHSPWYNNELEAMKRKLRRFEKIYNKTNSQFNYNNFNTIRKQYRQLLNHTKTCFIKDKINIYGKNTKKIYSLINRLSNNYSPTRYPTYTIELLPNIFANFFDDKIKNIVQSINDIKHKIPIYIIPLYNTAKSYFLNFKSPSSYEISILVKICKSSYPHNDSLPKQLTDLIEPTLTELYQSIISQSIYTSIFPTSLKYAIITPLLKNSNLDDKLLKNYRPISKLPFLSKIFERVISKQIIEYLSENELYPINQSAYRKNHSTETTIVSIFDNIYNAIDEGNKVQLVLLDMSAAFDTISHKILLDRLEEIGIADKALDLLKSYITNRTYRTLINDIQSDEFQLKYGVPQGSVLGPLLFLIYLRPLSLLISKFPQIKFNIFADDIIIYQTLPLENNDNSSLINCTNNIRNWLINNNLLLNIDKTLLINISKKLTQNKFPIYLIDNLIVEPSKTVKCLGVIIDEHMLLDNHLRFTAKKAFYYFSKVKKIRKLLSFHNLKMISQSYIISHLNYCNSIYYGITKSRINYLDRILRIIVRMIYGFKRKDHNSITECLTSLGWLEMRNYSAYRILCLTYTALNAKQPCYLYDIIKLKENTRRLRSSNNLLLSNQKFNLDTYGKRRFSVSAPALWNNLPLHLRRCNSIKTFKKAVKNHLLCST